MHPVRDRGQPVRTVIAGVHRGDHRKQHLRGADVAGGLVAADVLLAGLQRQPEGRRAVGVYGHADQPARQLPGMLGVHREVARMRAAETHWHTETLGAAERDVGTDVAGRGDQRQRKQVGAHRDQCAALVCLIDQSTPVIDASAGAGKLRDDPEEVAVGQAGAEVGGDDLDAKRFGTGGEHGRGLAVHVGVDYQPVRAPFPRTARCISVIASAAAVPSSSIEALATSSPVRSATIVWKFSSASSRPWLISGWYGV